jgi:GDP-4-dehydro-6-deoxy-D-mannose reductase
MILSSRMDPMSPPTSLTGRRVLVTGVTGFVGGYLTEALLERGATVFGLSRQADWPRSCAHLAGRVTLHVGDLADAPTTDRVLAEARPEQIYHLAAYAHAGKSFQEPGPAWHANLTATLALYDAVARWGGQPRILFVGSGQVYGDGASKDRPIDERCPLLPNSPYAASKAAADLASYQYTCHPGLDIIRARPFNHIGPRQSPQYAVASFARQLAAIERGQQPAVLETGDLTPQRDFTDVRDIVGAYLLLMEKGAKGEAYNVASGQSQSIQVVLDKLVSLCGVAVEVRRRADLLRARDLSVVRVDVSRLRQATGWAPRIPLARTLADTLDYWREQPAP